MPTYYYGLIAIIVLFLLFIILRRTKARHPDESVLSPNRRESFRLKFNNTFCDFQPLLSDSRQIGSIRDISSDGIRIEAKTDDLCEKSLLMLYFELQDETFIFEGIVKWKRNIGQNCYQYGIKFINVPTYEQNRLHMKLRIIKNREAQ
ncbi:PilZ domain-containing protein [Neobacillus sp. 114]|uniref:PilZ domain-containing protein n=1 Tax=Neobacillus sp. 114 TaxID=3048535 RepID=UPI0024C278C1|nr:PilZ domain-containing protein [Neobacillus sp. 114]